MPFTQLEINKSSADRFPTSWWVAPLAACELLAATAAGETGGVLGEVLVLLLRKGIVCVRARTMHRDTGKALCPCSGHLHPAARSVQRGHHFYVWTKNCPSVFDAARFYAVRRSLMPSASAPQVASAASGRGAGLQPPRHTSKLADGEGPNSSATTTAGGTGGSSRRRHHVPNLSLPPRHRRAGWFFGSGPLRLSLFFGLAPTPVPPQPQDPSPTFSRAAAAPPNQPPDTDLDTALESSTSGAAAALPASGRGASPAASNPSVAIPGALDSSGSGSEATVVVSAGPADAKAPVPFPAPSSSTAPIAPLVLPPPGGPAPLPPPSSAHPAASGTTPLSSCRPSSRHKNGGSCAVM